LSATVVRVGDFFLDASVIRPRECFSWSWPAFLKEAQNEILADNTKK